MEQQGAFKAKPYTELKWSFPVGIFSANVTKSPGNRGFGHIYWRNHSLMETFNVCAVLQGNNTYKNVEKSRNNTFIISTMTIRRIIREGSRAATTSKMECFVIIVNGFLPLTIITKHSILDVAAALDPPLITMTNPTATFNQFWANISFTYLWFPDVFRG